MGSCPKRTCDNGYTPVHEAARNASSHALQALLDYGASVLLWSRWIQSDSTDFRTRY